jgi:hypothetical protein
MRLYRNGTLEKKVQPKVCEHSHGYVMVPASGHFLARGSSHAYEHRIAYHAKHGDGPFNCHWCGVQVTWDTLHIDHLDDDKKNNAVTNLVASCPICNQKRGFEKVKKTWRTKVGVTALGHTKTLNEWAAFAGISRQSLLHRLSKGMPIEQAVTMPRGKFGPKSLIRDIARNG